MHIVGRVTDRELTGLMDFYRNGAADGGFEIGVRTALEAILASPYFVLRLEPQPENVQPGEVFRLSDEALASRLSFFLWGAPPDEELLGAGPGRRPERRGNAARPKRSACWPTRSRRCPREPLSPPNGFRLQDLYKVRPDPNFFPDFDENLADAMHTETELFFNSLVDEDRSVLDLFKADYTFVNESDLPTHYGFPGVSGTQFRRVSVSGGDAAARRAGTRLGPGA